MEEKWKVLLYRTLQGGSPVKTFIDSLELKVQSKVYSAIKLLEVFGILVSLPHVKKMAGTDLWELRILGSDSVRILYITITDKTFLLLHGFKKKKNKIPSKEIKIAKERLADYRSRS